MLRKIKSKRSWGLIVSPPTPPRGHLTRCNYLTKVNQIAEGGQGDIPPGLPPPLGERRDHLRNFLSQRKDEQNQVFCRA
jgi:hypothetical protein